jgi:uncharacterized protein (DUF1501 family)
MLIQSRREFLKLLALAGGNLAITKLLDPSFAYAAGGGGPAKNLVVINLNGGFDALAAFPYFADPLYGPNDSRNVANYLRNVARPSIFTLPSSTLAQANAGVFNLAANQYIGFCPAFSPLKPIFDAGGVALVQGVGITNNTGGNGSHEFCQNAYSFGTRDFIGGTSRGWFGRLIDQLGFSSNQAFGFGCGGRPDFLTVDPMRAPLVGKSAESLRWIDPSGSDRTALTKQYLRQLTQNADTTSPMRDEIRLALRRTADTTDLMEAIVSSTNPGGNRALVGSYPPAPHPQSHLTLGPALKSVARVISYYHGTAGRSQLFYTFQDGFDTHGNQGGFNGTGATSGYLHDSYTHVAQAISAFVADLKNTNRQAWSNTVIVLYSEFGRSARENGGLGSDHGHGQTCLVLGGPVRSGVYGTAPTADSLTAYNLVVPSIEFQNILSPAVRWFGGNAAEIFPESSYARSPAIADALFL